MGGWVSGWLGGCLYVRFDVCVFMRVCVCWVGGWVLRVDVCVFWFVFSCVCVLCGPHTHTQGLPEALLTLRVKVVMCGSREWVVEYVDCGWVGG